MKLPRLDEYDDSGADAAAAFLASALREPLPAGKDLLSVTVPAPVEALEKFLRLVPRTMGFLWRAQAGGRQLAGGGAAEVVAVRGEDRFRQFAERIPPVFARIESRSMTGEAPRPVLVGGFAFVPSATHDSSAWAEFVEDAFVLPRWGYHRLKREASITLTVRRAELDGPDAIERFCDELSELFSALDHESPTSLIQRFDIEPTAIHNFPQEAWRGYIAQIHEAIRTGAYEKIVAARECIVDLPWPVEDTGFMARVFAAYPDCTHFAVRRRGSTFLGATPETLFRKRGLELATHALAGTKRVKDDPAHDSSRDVTELQSSRKDRTEHQLVVEKIAAELGPLSERVTYADAPEGRQVRNLVHLQTPMTATLRPTTTVFDLIKALHPTPAVGGFPAREAAEWIRQNELLQRGWYTGAVGWIDSAGDAEFAVAIRCGLLTGKRAHIFAGAGVVAASDADAEYAETAGKMGPVLRALGVWT